MTQPKALILDQIIRIYKNTNDEVIGIHYISIQELREVFPNPIPGKINDSRFKRTGLRNVSFERFNLQMGESRNINKVQMIGKYDDFTYNNDESDIETVIYFGNSEVNTLEISLKDLPTIGDTL